ncbi:MAG TPA: F0F1 ATP synthase subunit B [Gemmatimonadaceae bacterium]|nr:F0F1 ATP synthase subunit B [Gemmatimonadaceae bacterium]
MRMRFWSVTVFATKTVAASVALTQEAAASPAPEHPGRSLVGLQLNLMFWTLAIFLILFFILRRFAFGPIAAAVEAREKALEAAIDAAKADRDAAAKLLAEHQAQIDAARGEAQKLISDGRSVAEKMRGDLLDQTRREQQEMLERARREIDSEKDRAIAQLRKEAVDLALAGASKVIEQNLESARNRQLVESYLSSIGNVKVG